MYRSESVIQSVKHMMPCIYIYLLIYNIRKSQVINDMLFLLVIYWLYIGHICESIYEVYCEMRCVCWMHCNGH